MNYREDPKRAEHRAEWNYELAATPEEVWEAIATAKGVSSWMVPTQFDPVVGSEISFEFGGFTSTGTITDYSPTTRFAYEEPWPIADRVEDIPPDMLEWFSKHGVPLSEVYEDLVLASPIATEFLVQSKSGSSCVVRIVSSAYGSGADWENEFFAEMIATTTPIWDGLATRFAKAAR